MKKFFSIAVCFALMLCTGLLFNGCKPKPIAMQYNISLSCSDYNYKDKLGEHFDFSLNGNECTITAKTKVANSILARSNNTEDCLKVNIYLTNSLEKFYNVKLERANPAVSGVTLDANDVQNNKMAINLSVTAGDLVGSRAISIIVSQGSVSGAVSVDQKGKKAVELSPVNIKINVVLFNASAND